MAPVSSKPKRGCLFRLLRVGVVALLLLAALIYFVYVLPFWGIPFNQSRHGRVPLTPPWALECWLWEDDVNTAAAVQELLDIHTSSGNYGFTVLSNAQQEACLVDLQVATMVKRVRLLNYDWSLGFQRYRIDSSLDGTTWSNLVDASTGQHTGWEDWSVDRSAQFLRFAGITNSESPEVRISELEVYGTRPLISVIPSDLDFGAVEVGVGAEQTLIVQNAGNDTLTGNASVSDPFSIMSGGTYGLGAGESQTVTIVYIPLSAGTNSATVLFTGGGGTNATVTGRAIGNGDSDGDGQTDWEEHVAGTSATNRNEYLAIQHALIEEQGGGRTIYWDSVTGRWYTVFLSRDFMGSWSNMHGLSGTGGSIGFTNDPAIPPPFFLRLGVEFER